MIYNKFYHLQDAMGEPRAGGGGVIRNECDQGEPRRYIPEMISKRIEMIPIFLKYERSKPTKILDTHFENVLHTPRCWFLIDLRSELAKVSCSV